MAHRRRASSRTDAIRVQRSVKRKGVRTSRGNDICATRTKVHPGLNVKRGGDDTLFATATGKVKFHRMRDRRVVSVVSD